MKVIFGEDLDSNTPAQLDLEALVDTGLLIQANSGGGKGYLICKILEVSTT